MPWRFAEPDLEFLPTYGNAMLEIALLNLGGDPGQQIEQSFVC